MTLPDANRPTSPPNGWPRFAPSLPAVGDQPGRSPLDALLPVRSAFAPATGSALAAWSPLSAPVPARPGLDVVQRDRTLVLNSPDGPVELRPREAARLDRRSRSVLAEAERAGAPITYLGVGRMPASPRLYPGVDTDWVLMRMDEDPLGNLGRFPIPEEQRRHLSALAAAGVEMDELLVAHELPEAKARNAAPELSRTGPSEIPVELLPTLIEHPGAAESTKRFSRRAGRVAEGAGQVAKGAVFTAAGLAAIAGGGLAMLAAAPIAAGALVAAAAVSLDPVIFGVRRVPGHRGVVQIYELVRWDW